MFEPITTAQGYITPENATTEIPRLINAAIQERRPVHLHLPIDVALAEIEVSETFQPEALPQQDVQKYVNMIEDKLKSASQPLIIAGHEINSFNLHEELEEIVDRTNIPVVQLSLGKGAFNEENPHYVGIFDGEIAEDKIKEYVNNSDAILNIGAKLTDSATAGFSYQFDIDDVVMINHKNFKMNDTVANDVTLPSLVHALKGLNFKNENDYPQYERPQAHNYELNNQPLTQETYFNMMQDFIQLMMS